MDENNTFVMSETEQQKNSKKHHKFLWFVLIYAAVGIALISAGLFWFNSYIRSYENSRPLTAVTNYVASLAKTDIMELARDYVAGLEYKVQSDDAIFDYLDSVFSGYDYAKSTAESTEEHPVYILRNNGIIFGKITLGIGETDRYGFSPWVIEKMEYNFDVLFSTGKVTVPSTYEVKFEGTALDTSFISNNAARYELLDEFYDCEDVISLPVLKEYSYTITSDKKIDVYDNSGNIVPEDYRNEEFYVDNCTKEEKKLITSFAEEFVSRYVRFMSNADYNIAGNYYSLSQLVVTGSQLQIRLYQAEAGLGFSSSHGDTIQSINVNHYMNTGSDYYAFDVTYNVETIGQKGPVVTTNRLKLLIVQREWGDYSAIAMYTF